MALNETTPGTRVFVSAPNFFTIMGRQEQIPIKQFRRHLQVLNNIANRADHQNPYKTFELIDEETSTMACFGVGFGPGSPRVTEAKEESFHTIQPESSNDAENLVATEIDHTVPSQKMAGKDLSAIRDGFGITPPAAPKPILDSTVMAATPGKKVHRGLHAQPDFNYVQHEFDAKGMSLKKLWHQYRQSHPNKRTYEYSQFCNRFKDWIASQAGTALSQGP